MIKIDLDKEKEYLFREMEREIHESFEIKNILERMENRERNRKIVLISLMLIWIGITWIC